jgi:dTDP-4-amino-4,6-dideoxygalactose transaminase
MVGLPDGAAAAIAAALADDGIDTRRWWGMGCHRDTAFAGERRDDLSVTDRLAQSTLGLPFSIDLDAGEIDRIADAMNRALDRL